MDESSNRFFEEFIRIDLETPKCLGIKVIEGNPDGRLLGYAGRMEFEVTEPIELKSGHKMVRISASKKRPIKVATMLQKLG